MHQSAYLTAELDPEYWKAQFKSICFCFFGTVMKYLQRRLFSTFRNWKEGVGGKRVTYDHGKLLVAAQFQGKVAMVPHWLLLPQINISCQGRSCPTLSSSILEVSFW
jgi:hypothetical protein